MKPDVINLTLLLAIPRIQITLPDRFIFSTELDIEGVGIVVADAAVQYRSEAFHGETLRAEMAPADFNKYGCDLMWRLSDVASGREVARGKTGILFFDYAARKPAGVPAGFLAKVGG